MFIERRNREQLSSGFFKNYTLFKDYGGLVLYEGEQVCRSRRHCWERFTCSVAVPEPVLPTVPGERGCSFCLRNSSQARPTHLFWSVSAAEEQPPFISCAQNCVPNHSLAGLVFTSHPHLAPGTFN